MLDVPLMILVQLPVVNRIHQQRKKFSRGVENKATGDSKLDEQIGKYMQNSYMQSEILCYLYSNYINARKS